MSRYAESVPRIVAEEGLRMKRTGRLLVGRLLLVAVTALSPAAHADFEIAGPDGRRFLLKDNGTWQALDVAGNDRADDNSKQAAQAVLRLERRIERGNNCRFVVRLINNLPYEISTLVPYYAAYRANGVIYDTVSSPTAFTAVRPGDKLVREFEFTGIACQDIARVQVVGGDRCEMGDLHKFSEGKGQCLARVRVEASDLVRFDK